MKEKFCEYCNKKHKSVIWGEDEEGRVYCGKWRYYIKDEEE